MPRHRPFFTLLILALLALPAAGQPVGIHWQQDIESAKTLARESGRLVLIHFWTPSCGPCMMLNQNVFNQPGVGTAIEAQFVPVKLNANENSATAVGYGITRVPTDVVITPDGEVIGQLISPPTPSAYVAELGQLANQYATRSGQAFAKAAAAAPFAAPEFVHPAYADLPVGQNVAPAAPAATSTPSYQIPAVGTDPIGAPQQAAATLPATSPPARYATQQQPQTGHYTAFPMASQTPTPSGTNAASIAATATNGVGATVAPAPLAPPAIVPPVVVANRFATAPPAESGLVPVAPAPNQFANPFVAGATQSPATSAAASPPAAAGAAATPDGRRLPSGAPPLGFDGYCPVSMRNHWKWVAGDPQYGVIHRGRTYWFAGPQEQQQFWSNPDQYSPALSGVDAVLAVDHKQQVPGKREHSLDYDNLFYLFSSEATLQQFAANPERYAATVRQAMGIERGRYVQ